MIRSKLAKDSRREQTVWISVTLEGTPSLTPFQLFCNELGHSQIMTPVSDSTWSATLQLHAELKEIADMLSGEIGTKMYLSGKVSLWGCVCVWEREIDVFGFTYWYWTQGNYCEFGGTMLETGNYMFLWVLLGECNWFP